MMFDPTGPHALVPVDRHQATLADRRPDALGARRRNRAALGVDVVGLYPPDLAAVVAAATASDPGSGPVAMDD